MVEVDDIAMTCPGKYLWTQFTPIFICNDRIGRRLDQLPAKWEVRFQLISALINIACQDKNRTSYIYIPNKFSTRKVHLQGNSSIGCDAFTV